MASSIGGKTCFKFFINFQINISYWGMWEPKYYIYIFQTVLLCNISFSLSGANLLTLQSVGWEFCNVIGLIGPSGNIEWWKHIFRKWKTFIMANTKCFHWDSLCFTHLRTYQCPEEHWVPVDIQTIYIPKRSILVSQTSYKFISMTLCKITYYQYSMKHYKSEWNLSPAFKKFTVW